MNLIKKSCSFIKSFILSLRFRKKNKLFIRTEYLQNIYFFLICWSYRSYFGIQFRNIKIARSFEWRTRSILLYKARLPTLRNHHSNWSRVLSLYFWASSSFPVWEFHSSGLYEGEIARLCMCVHARAYTRIGCHLFFFF